MAIANPVEVQKFLKGVDYPANTQDLIQHAQKQGANEEVCSTLEQLAEQEFETPADVSHAIGNLE